ncbi:MAG: phosphopantetheine-binding protein [Pontiellaceae bacterium]|jgi:acyl carrier protein|nr:phosphopantetheine-binding protein [Pontiellaceae bacterium]
MSDVNKEAQLAEIKAKLKRLLIEQLSLEDVSPEDITDDGELFGDGLGLDSLDAVEIVVLLQRNFSLEVKDMEQSREVFRTVNSLAEYVYSKTQS